MGTCRGWSQYIAQQYIANILQYIAIAIYCCPLKYCNIYCNIAKILQYYCNISIVLQYVLPFHKLFQLILLIILIFKYIFQLKIISFIDCSHFMPWLQFTPSL